MMMFWTVEFELVVFWLAVFNYIGLLTATMVLMLALQDSELDVFALCWGQTMYNPPN